MGVTGLSTYINSRSDAFEDHLLRDTKVVVDANNLNQKFLRSSQANMRCDLFGGDMVKYGRLVTNFIKALRSCNVEPIMVFDGAQTDDEHSKTPEKHRRALNRFREVQKQADRCDRAGFGQVIMPVMAAYTLRELIVDNQVEIVQCMYEADSEAARIANNINCPLLSDDSDFFIFDLHKGVISIESINVDSPTVVRDGTKFIRCRLYRIDNFVRNYPNLDKKCLPILSVLAGNDYVKNDELKSFCDNLPLRRIYDFLGMTNNQFHSNFKNNECKIIKILFFLCDKTPEQAINEICQHFAKGGRRRWQEFILKQLEVYDVSGEYVDTFDEDFLDLALKMDRSSSNRSLIEEEALVVSRWLRDCYRKSGVTQRLLEIMYRNIVYIRSIMDDLNLPSANECQYRATQVLVSLLKFHKSDNRSLKVFDRIHDKFNEITLVPMKSLPGFSLTKCSIYDIPTLPHNTKRLILVATFHCSVNQLELENRLHKNLFKNEKDLFREYVTIRMLLNFIDQESQYKLPNIFLGATLLTMLYYFHKLCPLGAFNFDISRQIKFINRHKLYNAPRISKQVMYSREILHDINRLQASMLSFNLLNGLLGCVMDPLRPHLWLNCCLIYNLLDRNTITDIGVPDFINRPFAQPNLPQAAKPNLSRVNKAPETKSDSRRR